MTKKPSPMKTGFEDTTRALAAIQIERVVGKAAGEVAGKAAGVFVEPAYWVVTRKKPDAVDVGLVAVGLAGPIGLISSVVTGIVKDIVDDQTEFLLDAVKQSEPAKRREGIKATVKYSGWSGQYINAMTIASKGGTAWLHPNGLWVYMTAQKGLLVPDYMPAKAKKIFQPVLPLVQCLDGFKWHEL